MSVPRWRGEILKMVCPHKMIYAECARVWCAARVADLPVEVPQMARLTEGPEVLSVDDAVEASHLSVLTDRAIEVGRLEVRPRSSNNPQFTLHAGVMKFMSLYGFPHWKERCSMCGKSRHMHDLGYTQCGYIGSREQVTGLALQELQSVLGGS